MNNRFLELQNINKDAGSFKERLTLGVDDGSKNGKSAQVEFAQFQEKLTKAKKIAESIHANSEQIKTLKEQYQKAITANIEKDVSKELDAVIARNHRYTNDLKVLLTDLDKNVQQSQETAPDESETKMKLNNLNALKAKVNEIMQESQKVQTEYKFGLRQKIQRQTKFLDPTLSDDQVKELCNDPDQVNQLLQKKLYGQASLQLQNAVSDIQDKYRDIRKLEASIQEVYQMFQDMAMLVHQQGVVIDDIEANITEAKKNVEDGNKNLQKAKEHHQSSRKKMCCLIIIGLAILLAIIIPVIATR